MVAPLTPPTCDLRDFPYIPLHIGRLKQSRAWLLCKRNPAHAFYLVNVWTAAYHSVPAGSLEDDDLTLADFAMCDDKTWAKVKANVLRGWVKCDDGRLYNPTVSEQSLEGWLQKIGQRKATAAASAARTKQIFDATPFERLISEALAHLQVLNPASRLLLRRGIIAGAPDRDPHDAPGGPPGGASCGPPGSDPSSAPERPPREEKRREENLGSSEGKPSEARASPADPPKGFGYDPDDPVATMFFLGKQLWGQRQGGALVGKLRKAVDDDYETAALMRTIAQDLGPEDGRAYLMGIVKSRERSAELTPQERGEAW